MSIDAISSSTAAAAAAATTATTSANQLTGSKDEFLKLFMAQLQNQDPLSPKTDTDMVAQLAQFSAVEQAQQTNQQLSNLAAAQSSSSNASMSSLVGRQCQANLGDITVDGTAALPPIDVTGPAPGASIVITDANGKQIRTLPVPAAGGAITWDGRDSNGKLVSGSYHVAINSGSSTALTAHWSGRVDAVELTANGPRLRMGGLLLAPGDVTTIGAESAITPTTTTSSTTTNPTATVSQGAHA